MAKKPKLGSGGRFRNLVAKLAGKVRDPAAVAASIGRKKYGAEKMAMMSRKGMKRAMARRRTIAG